MKYIKYSKFAGDPFDGLSAEDLLQMLQDFLLDSGFYGQYYDFYEMDSEYRSVWPATIVSISART
jgi:hypothetical protein